MTTADVPAQREGFARALVSNLFPQFHDRGSAFASDVQFVYDWEASAKHSDFLDPLNISSGDYKTRNAAMLSSAHWIKQHPHLLDSLRHGDTAKARESLHGATGLTVGKGAKMPSPIDKKSGKYNASGVPSIWDELGGTVTGIPGAFGKDVSGIGSLLGNHVVLIIVVLALILVMKK